MEISAQVGRWSIRFNPDVNRQLYANTPVSSCECVDCMNFRAAGVDAFSPPFLHLLDQLGIDHGKPAELCHYGASGESMPTQGWFHLVGHLDGGADAWYQTSDNTHVLDPEPFLGIKSFGFTSRVSLVPEAFEGHPVIQLEFETTVPWVTDAPLA